MMMHSMFIITVLSLQYLLHSADAMPYLFDLQIAEHQLGQFFYNELRQQKIHFGAFLAIAARLRRTLTEELCDNCINFALNTDQDVMENLLLSKKFLQKMEQCINERKVSIDAFVANIKLGIINGNRKKLMVDTISSTKLQKALTNGLLTNRKSLANGTAVNVEPLKPKNINGQLSTMNGFHKVQQMKNMENGLFHNGKQQSNEFTGKVNGTAITTVQQKFDQFANNIGTQENHFFILLINFIREKTFEIQSKGTKNDFMEIRDFFLALCTTMHHLLMRFAIAVDGHFGIRYQQIFKRMGLEEARMELNNFYKKFADDIDHFIMLPFSLPEFNSDVINFSDEEMNELISKHTSDSSELDNLLLKKRRS